MTEKELILKLIGIEGTLDSLIIQRNNNLSKNELDLNVKEEENIKTEYDIIVSELNKFVNEKTSQTIRNIIISTFTQMKIIKSNNNFGLYVSKRQSMISNDWFIGKMLIEIKKVMHLDFSGISKPILNLTDDIDDGIKIDTFNDFLKNEIKIISNINQLN